MTSEEVDIQYHGVHWPQWPDTVWGCSALTRSCNMEQDCIWRRRTRRRL